MITRKIVITFAMSFVIIGCGCDKSTTPEPRELTMLGTFDYSGYIHEMFVQDQYVYLAGDDSGMAIINAVEPESPSLARFYYAPRTVSDIFISGDYVYLACGDSGLIILDISDPYNPAYIGNYAPPENPNFWIYAVYVEGGHLYLGPGGGGLEIFDISNPENPIFLSRWQNRMTIGQIYVSQNIAYIVSFDLFDSAYLLLVDVSDYNNPDSTGIFYIGWAGARRVQVSGNHAFFSSFDYPGLAVLDISDPSSPTFLGEFDTPGTVMDIFIAGENRYVGMNAYVADGDSGLQIVNILSPRNPSIIESYDISGFASLVFQENEYIYLVKYDTGLMIFRYAPRIVH